jgi:hypothetical protein
MIEKVSISSSLSSPFSREFHSSTDFGQLDLNRLSFWKEWSMLDFFSKSCLCVMVKLVDANPVRLFLWCSSFALVLVPNFCSGYWWSVRLDIAVENSLIEFYKIIWHMNLESHNDLWIFLRPWTSLDRISTTQFFSCTAERTWYCRYGVLIFVEFRMIFCSCSPLSFAPESL